MDLGDLKNWSCLLGIAALVVIAAKLLTELLFNALDALGQIGRRR